MKCNLLGWLKKSSHPDKCNHEDLKYILEKLMALAQDLVAAAVTLSTAADGLSIKVDKLVDSADKVLAALADVTLPAGAQAALDQMKTAATNAAAEGDKVDSEVSKLDSALPAPAPPAPNPPA